MVSYISVLDLFSVGIGPSSSHTVGPMRAATAFVTSLADEGVLSQVGRVTVKLCGSLGATGLGHGTPDAVLAGLRGHAPETCDPAAIPGGVAALGDGCTVELDETHAVSGGHEITMTRDDVVLAPLTRMPGHPNGMRFTAFATVDEPSTPIILSEKDYYSVGGGFVVAAEDLAAVDASGAARGADPTHRPPVPAVDVIDVVPHPFASADELLVLCDATGMSIAEIAWENECALRPAAEVISGLDAIWRVMSECVDAGLARVGVLPGSLNVKRRARALGDQLSELEKRGQDTAIEWLQAFAMAVNEENADGRRVVTAPTNGAAGVIPAVGRHLLRQRPDLAQDEEARRATMRTYLLTAGAIGALYKRNASISGAEAGCQGEVGSACSMAAGALTAVMGGTPLQIENAAEIAMEHNLGLTCDPVGGLVQVPCIERNAIAACTAVSATRLALQGDGSHVVSLDTVIETMRQTGLDMSTKYKETSTGGLAVNVIEC
ncbi:L-serine ammonia-lyase [Sanguibacter antarcticus]|uniref:L-serine dehydratase n=1 Tax=Sanguibacter antarcticus TaxID=372484 RepID=A0A2A9E4W9_9MICO|nr:L-serine ammonia-lyase [Sanguibacter antarcticus]PFG33240.1 L-serine dehydratase [Sanguibacter antarcticus]